MRKKKNILSVEKKKIIVFGSSGLLGNEYVNHLAAQGAFVAALDIKIDKLNKKNSSEGNIKYYKCDILKINDLKNNLKKIIKDFGEIDTVVNCSAVDAKFDNKFNSNQFSNLYKYPTSLWQKSLDVNLTGALNISRVFGEFFEMKKKGQIIFIGSNLGLVAPNHSIYNSSKKYKVYKPADYVVTKFGLIGLMKYLASYYQYKNIRVNMITPCGIETNQSKKFKKKFSQKTLINRMSKIDEFNGALQFLCSDSSSYMTGSNMIIDGGWTVT